VQMREQILYDKSIEVKSIKELFRVYGKRLYIVIGIMVRFTASLP
jgi:hypothetical protein